MEITLRSRYPRKLANYWFWFIYTAYVTVGNGQVTRQSLTAQGTSFSTYKQAKTLKSKVADEGSSTTKLTKWLTTFSPRHNCRAEKFCVTPFVFLRVRYSTPSSRKSWEIWDLGYRNRSWRIINTLYHEWTKSWSSYWALPVENICKTLTKTSRSCCTNSYVYRTRHVALFQRALKLHACSVLLRKEVAKKSQIDFLTPRYSKTDRISYSKKFRINS